MEIIQKKIRGCDDSFFYEGTIATKEARGGEYVLSACGEIKLTCDDKPINDKEVRKCYENDHFSMNNWFEIWFESDEWGDEEFGIFYSYDEAMKELKELE